MSKLLCIKASPRGTASKGSAVADVYVAALRERLPDLVVDTLDLAQEKLPDFDGDKVAAKMAIIAGQAHEGRQKTAWEEITAVANRFISADRYLISVPMWNGGIPYRGWAGCHRTDRSRARHNPHRHRQSLALNRAFSFDLIHIVDQRWSKDP